MDELGDLKAHRSARGLWGFIPITGPRQVYSDDSLPTHRPLKSLFGGGGRGSLKHFNSKLESRPWWAGGGTL